MVGNQNSFVFVWFTLAILVSNPKERYFSKKHITNNKQIKK